MPVDTRQKLLAAGTTLFATHGFAGASVRDICAEAGVGRNLIGHHFGSKQGLLDAILEAFSTDAFAPAVRVIDTPADSSEAFRLRFELFAGEVLEALVAHSDVFKILVRENTGYLPFTAFRAALIQFLQEAETAGFLAPDTPLDMVVGLLLDRLGNQVLYALNLGEVSEQNILRDERYRKIWLAQNTGLILNGLSPNPQRQRQGAT